MPDPDEMRDAADEKEDEAAAEAMRDAADEREEADEAEDKARDAENEAL